jgi:hypothetical protein
MISNLKRKKMRLVFIALILATMACKKQNAATGEGNSTTQLLTKKVWILHAVGFDDNHNGILDVGENVIQECQKDNSYQFSISGTGSIKENAIVCNPPGNNDFNWTLVDDSVLTIGFQEIVILNLSETEMLLQPEIPGLAVNFLMSYRR